MKNAKEVLPPVLMAIFGIATMYSCFQFLKGSEGELFKELSGIIRVIVALAAAAISIALPGLLEIGNPSTTRTAPNIKASGALAVFVLVYLFNPINFS